jgi:hypothetical protein
MNLSMKHLKKLVRGLALALGTPLLFGFMGQPGAGEPLTFWWWNGDPTVLRPTLECALERIRAATCLPVDVSFDAAHWVRQKPAADMGGRAGWTTGASWSATRIALLEGIDGGYACGVLTHEIAQHTLRRRNDHAAGYSEANKRKLYEGLLTEICEVQTCGCFNPEP